MDETRITQIPPVPDPGTDEEEFRTEKDVVEEMADLGEEHIRAVAESGSEITGEEMIEDERRLEQQGNDRDDGGRSDKLEPAQGTPDADPQGSGEEDQPDEDPGSGIPAGGDAEEPGEVPTDEPGAEAADAQGPPEKEPGSETHPAGEDARTDAAVEEAAKKLKDWKQTNKRPYATLICDHLIKRSREDAGFAQDVLKEAKTWDKCFGFIKGEARKKASEGVACIEDHVVYEWAEDYIRSEDKPKAKKAVAAKTKKSAKASENARPDAENAQSEPENDHSAAEAEQQKPDEKPAKAKKAKPKTEPKKPKAEKEKPEKPQNEKPQKEKKDKNTIDGQIDLFSLFE